ncbi:pyrrolo-quinoline quinone [Haloarcula sp. CBA1130]|uniref:PQQ-binding-like beta-propeller repeat protein n=1 Tax=unclassified Haloarcula TaxID=2624677 RepID=UPI0012442C91|nr:MULTISPECIES: PQQ-binding-like beta-propeller repeat protein [unclassified Haloarcula]KAA9396193.1 pyrrolo-quinoline quinone [Haloarcula sp. CBA1129]KAA9400278.1 pyrrolo-quinoline quinone [Haloarcula sp. CBA1130]
MPSSRRRFLGFAALGITGSGGLASLDTQERTDSQSPSDWPMGRYDPPGTGYNPKASGPKDGVAVAWTHQTPDWFRGSTQPIRRGETLYIGGNGLLALDSETGQRRFSFQGPYHSSPTIAPASIYETKTLGLTGPSGVYGVNANGGHALFPIERTVGEKRWTGPQSPAPGFFGPAESTTPVTANGTIYTAVPGTNSIVALDPNNGAVLWRRTHHADDAVSGTYNRPAVDDGIVFATAWPQQATAYRADTGELHWNHELEEMMVLPPAATDEGVVIPTRESVQLRARSDGTLLWERNLDANVTDSAPAVANGTIFVADEQESLHALSLTTGETRWTAPFDGKTTPVVAADRVYAVDSLWALKAFDVATGEQMFEYHPQEVPLSPPIVGDGILYLANRGRILALEEA